MQIDGGIKCRKAFFGCIFCGKKIEVGEIYTKFSDDTRKNKRVHRACALRRMGVAIDPLTREEVA